jgi:tetratricopeptide (TPR) repeat protein
MRVFFPLLILIFSSCTQLQPYFQIVSGNYEYNRGEMEQANRIYGAGLENQEFTQWFQFNLANVYTALGEKLTARSTLESLLDSDDTILQFHARYNYGLLLYELQDFSSAYVQFKEALLLNPGHLPTKLNLELSLEKINAQNRLGENSELNPLVVNPRESETDRILEYIKQREASIWQSSEGVEFRGRDW